MKDKLLISIWIVSITFIIVLGIYPKIKLIVLTKDNTEETGNSEINEAFAKDKSEKSSYKGYMSINLIKEEHDGTHVTIIGIIEDRKEHSKGHLFLTVGDFTGKIKVPIFANKLIDAEYLQTNNICRITGKVDTYKEELEIIPEKNSDINLLGKSKLNLIEEKNVGNRVNFIASVISKYNHEKGHIFLTVKIFGSNQELDVPIFSSLNYKEIGLDVNSIIEVNGLISKYKNKLQVKPESSNDIRILQKASLKQIEFFQIGKVNKKLEGKTLKFKGYVSEIIEKKGNTFFSFNDNTGSIRAVLFKSDAKELPQRKNLLKFSENNKSNIFIAAEVNIYKNNLQLIVYKVYK